MNETEPSQSTQSTEDVRFHSTLERRETRIHNIRRQKKASPELEFFRSTNKNNDSKNK